MSCEINHEAADCGVVENSKKPSIVQVLNRGNWVNILWHSHAMEYNTVIKITLCRKMFDDVERFIMRY